jgi:uncharacterized protein affecting Mg2+/Co2+ transport
MASANVVPTLYRCLRRQAFRYGREASKRGFTIDAELKQLSRLVIHGESLTPPEGFRTSDPMSSKAAEAILKKVFRGCSSPHIANAGTQQALIGLGFKSLTYLANRAHVLETFPEEGEHTLESHGCTLTSKASYLGHYGNFVHGVHISLKNTTDQQLLLLDGELLTTDELLNNFKFVPTFEAKTRVVQPGQEYVMHFSKHVISTMLGTVGGTLSVLTAKTGETLVLDIPPVLLSLTPQSSPSSQDITASTTPSSISSSHTPSSSPSDTSEAEHFKPENTTNASDPPSSSGTSKDTTASTASASASSSSSSTSTSTSSSTPTSKAIQRNQERECAGSTPTPL